VLKVPSEKTPMKLMNAKIFARPVMSRAASGALLCMALLLCLLSFPVAPAQAAPETVPFTTLQFKLFRIPDGYTGGVWAFLAPEVELPATVQIAVPTGVEVFFFGEVPPGGVNSETPTFPQPYNVVTRGDYDIYTAVAENSHNIQLEFYLEHFPVRAAEDGNHAIRIEYTPLTDLEVLRLAAFIPAGSTIVTPEAEYLGTGPTGDISYAVATIDVVGGETYSVDLEYTPPEVTARENAAGVSGGILAVVGAVIFTAIVVAGLLLFMKVRKGSDSSDDDNSGDNHSAFE